MQVLDESELKLGLEGDVILKDAESDSLFKTFITNRFRQYYDTELQRHTAGINDICNQLNFKFLQVSASTPIFDTFYRLVKG